MTGPDEWLVTCYGEPTYERFPDAAAAKNAAEAHIRQCPEGPMPWAKVEWHQTDLGVWVSAAGGQWLNHHVRTRLEEDAA